MTPPPARTDFAGGCHCGRVRFEVDAATPLEVLDCNCSICRMTGFLHLIVPATRFRLLSGADALVFAPLVDHILFVVRAGATRPAEALRALRMLPQEKIVGVVLNGEAS